MADAPERLFRAHAEQVVAATRVGLAGVTLFSIWLDPADPPHFAELTYSLHAGYVLYSLLLALFVWRRGIGGGWPLVTHAVDIVVFSVFQFLTLGPSSPLFVYFIFVLFSGTIRWGWRGALLTAPILLLAFVVMGVWMSRTLPPEIFELNRFLIRTGYLLMVAALLVYLGLHEARLRDEIEQLARWPVPAADDPQAATRQLLAHAASMLEAVSVVALWSSEDDPHTVMAFWSASEFTETRHPPAELDSALPGELAEASFLVSDAGAETALVKGDRGMFVRPVPKFHPQIAERLSDPPIVSAPYRTERLSGRLFFSGTHGTGADVVTLVEIVAREFGASLDQIAMHARQRQLAIGEERVRVARDLHDGVLQALTGVRLELQGMATTLEEERAPRTRDRLLALERALAIEQRELRRFIEGLRPFIRRAPGTALGTRLEELRERVLQQWKIPLTIRTDDPLPALAPEIEDALPQMVHEAVANALQHGHPSRIAVDVRVEADHLRVAVTDDGHGFRFQGRYDHRTLMERNLGPTSLCERVASLGGEVTIDSGVSGARVEMFLPLAPRKA